MNDSRAVKAKKASGRVYAYGVGAFVVVLGLVWLGSIFLARLAT
jgi:anaerobic C4-dicarboxylate transporter